MNLQSIKEAAADLINIGIDLDQKIRSSRKRYILCFHRVVDANYAQAHNIHHSMWVSPATFESTIRWLKQIGEIVNLDRIMDFAIDNAGPLFSITFDDGWIDNYTKAFPILQKYEASATIFLVTDAISTDNLFWVDEFIEKAASRFNRPASPETCSWLQSTFLNSPWVTQKNGAELLHSTIEALKTLSDCDRDSAIMDFYTSCDIDASPIKGHLITWQQVVEMAKQGIDFQSHTHTHRILVNTPDDVALDELTTSKKILEEKLNAPIRHFCYPNARYEENKTYLVGEAGYGYGFKIDNQPLSQVFDRYLVPRILVCENYSKKLNYLKLRLLGAPLYNRR